MKSYLLLFPLLLASHFSAAQLLSEDTLSGNPYYLSVIEAEDKGKKVNVYILETLPKRTKYRMVRALYCKDSTLAFNSYHTPSSCVEWSSFNKSNDRITKVDENGARTNVKNEDLPDSSKTIDKKCLNAFYAQNNDSIQVDTIYVANKNLAYSTIYYISKCSYIKNKKHGKEVQYYELWELEGECVENDKRVKCIGSWEKGKKTGVWSFFNINGEIIRTEHYKKGKLKKVTENPVSSVE